MLERHVAVGVDGSVVSTRALDAAAEEAMRRSVPLEIVYAVPDLDTAGPVLTACAARVRRRFPRLPVHLTPVAGDPADALGQRSGHAALLVVGARALGGLAALTSRSVSRRLLDRARCPVLVVKSAACRTPARDGSGVVLFVVADDADVDAAAVAFAEAARRGFGVRFLHTGPRLPPPPASRRAQTDVPLSTAPTERAERAELTGQTEQLERTEMTAQDGQAGQDGQAAQTQPPGPAGGADHSGNGGRHGSADVVPFASARDLIAAGAGADIAVVAHHRHGGSALRHRRSLRTLLHQAPCRVLVVPVDGP